MNANRVPVRKIGPLVLVILMLLVGGVYAQGGVVSLSIDDFHLDEYPTARAFVTVRNENGVPIGGLEPEKFEIVEDGATSFPPSEALVQVNQDAVTSVVLVIDISGSMRGKPIEEAMRAANTLLDQLSPQDRVAIVAFADEMDTDPANLVEGRELGFTIDKNAARNVVNFLDEQIGWDTPLYDAVFKGVKMVSTEPAGKRAVIVMTDGVDERDNAQGVAVKDAGSLSSPDDPIHEANRHNIPIFTVGLGTKIDDKYLGRVAERTGGVYQQAPEAEELTPLFENVINQLKQQYALTYNSMLPDDGSYHSLLIRVQLPQGQAWGETKFQFISDEPPPVVDTQETGSSDSTTDSGQSGSSSDESPPVIVAEANATSPPVIGDSDSTSSSSDSGIVDRVRDMIEENPLIAALIGGGVLLLLLLLIILIVVLARGGGDDDEAYDAADYVEPHGPPSDWSEGATSPSAPAYDAPAYDATVGGMTEVATSDWDGSAGAVPPPPGPLPVPPPPVPVAADPGDQIPVAGGTRIIERAAKHMAMLVEKARPDRKYDLMGTTNVGRSQDNQVVLDDVTISRHHAWIKVEGEDFMVFDIGSANGTYVNDQQVEAPLRLENGDVVRFGEVELVFTKVF